MGKGNHPHFQWSWHRINSKKIQISPTQGLVAIGREGALKPACWRGAKPSAEGFSSRLKIHQQQGMDVTLPQVLHLGVSLHPCPAH